MKRLIDILTSRMTSDDDNWKGFDRVQPGEGGANFPTPETLFALGTPLAQYIAWGRLLRTD